MVKCSFCGKDLKEGSGKIYAKKDGTVFYFCSGKCEKNLIELKRKPVKVKWTDAYNKLKQTLIASKGTSKDKSKKVVKKE
ncbi:MAG: 50S ribosomal protein L24e [Candidatus ainarchaeum sp.]|nr:50S ribosomal protein L24e [Candidatus ainarchaeum sp.]